MKTLITQLTEIIERTFDVGGQDFSRKIIVFPCGDVGIQCINIMEKVYDLRPAYVLDNHKCKYNPKIKPVAFLDNIECSDYVLILTSTNSDIYDDLKEKALEFFSSENILELEEMNNAVSQYPQCKTKIGKYSYGPICCNHPLIKEIGAFCSFAEGCSVVDNHATNLLSTSKFLYYSNDYLPIYPRYEKSVQERPKEFLPGVCPKAKAEKEKCKITIGNDVWLGKNVIITNYSDIGNGVIAGAGAVITKDIPDYAVVAGVPARIIRYRYSKEQIEALNKIAWWDWTDDEIRERYDDFYLNIEDFIRKYL